MNKFFKKYHNRSIKVALAFCNTCTVVNSNEKCGDSGQSCVIFRGMVQYT